MGWFDRLFRSRERHLQSNEPERAFAPEPGANYWLLDSNKTNDEAYSFIRHCGVSLIRARSGETAELSDFRGGVLLFATTWEPYSAKTIGGLKQNIDRGQCSPLAIVFFENTNVEVVGAKKESWYFPNTWTLAASSAELKPLIARVPFQVVIGGDGEVERILEGMA